MALPQPDRYREALRDATLADARSSLAVTDALLRLLDDEEPRPRCRGLHVVRANERGGTATA